VIIMASRIFSMCCGMILAIACSGQDNPNIETSAVGLGADGSVFVIGAAHCDADGCGIYRLEGGNFVRIEGSAVRIAVDPTGNPWVVNRSGRIYRFVGGHFQHVPGLATDIGVGADGSVFVIGTTPCDANGCGIYRFDGDNFQRIEGSAERISVDAAGNPWVVNRAGRLYRLVRGRFQHVADRATDVGIGADGSVFVIGTTPCDANGCGIYRFDGARYQQLEGSAVRVAVDPAGNPWVVNRSGRIYRLVGGHFQQVAEQATDVQKLQTQSVLDELTLTDPDTYFYDTYTNMYGYRPVESAWERGSQVVQTSIQEFHGLRESHDVPGAF
jgi:hypothetical protein